MYVYSKLFEGSLEANLPTIWTDGKAEVGRVREEKRREDHRRGSCDVEKVHSVVARSTFRSQNAQNTLLEVVMLKKCTLLWRAARQRKCTPLWRKAHFHVKMLKTRHARITLESSNVVPRGRRKGFCILPNVSKMWGFCSISKNDGKRGTFEEDLEWSGNMHFTWQAQYKRHVYLLGGHYADFLRGVAFWRFRFAKMILRNRCSTSYQLASLLRGGRRGTLHRWSGEIEEEVSQNCLVFDVVNFENWRTSRRIASLSSCQLRKLRTSRRIASFFMLPTSKLEDVSQNCFVFHVANFENWGRLAELLRFSCCQLRKLRTSRRIASFFMLPTSKIEDVSQNCFVFHVANFENWGRLAELLRFSCCQLRKLRTSRRIASFFMLPTSKIEDVSQNCFVFHVANFENWGRLAELLRFSCCQLRKLRTSRRIASFFMLPTSKIEDVSQNCFVFHVANFENWGRLAELLHFHACRYRQIDV